MPKPFHFKQFTIHHTLNAMKVSTDACVFGVVVADFFCTQKHIVHAADIGAGTGLLSCIVQQKNPSILIDAIEIEPSFSEEMESNIQTCQFENHITIINKPLQEYESTKQYDFIFSNPPFFSNQMLSTDLQRRQARHTILLTPQDIFLFAENYLQSNGFLFLLLPYTDVDIWIKVAQQFGLSVSKKINIKTQIDKPYSRVIIGFGFMSCCIEQEEFIYTNTNNEYTDEFKTRLKDYYLFL